MHRLLLFVSAVSFLTLLVGQTPDSPKAPAHVSPNAEAMAAIFQPPLTALDRLPRSAEDQAKVDLGRHLYYEKRLSSNNQVACNSCHLLEKYGVDGLSFSLGVPGKLVGRNSPTTYNAFFHIAQFWDGRAATVEEQAKGPILAGKEMGMPSAAAVVAKLKAIPEYRPLFKKAFPRDVDAVTYDNVGNAIGAFERNLVTPGRFDDFLAGKVSALSAQEQRGLKTFVTTGCVTCHTGPLVGGNSYQKLGLLRPWPNQADEGRSAVVGNDAYKMFFNVPSLRNIEKTGPYFHDSSAKTLEEAVTKMAKHQLGRELTGEQLADIVSFLQSLTGKIPAEYIKKRPF